MASFFAITIKIFFDPAAAENECRYERRAIAGCFKNEEVAEKIKKSSMTSKGHLGVQRKADIHDNCVNKRE